MSLTKLKNAATVLHKSFSFFFPLNIIFSFIRSVLLDQHLNEEVIERGRERERGREGGREGERDNKEKSSLV